MSRPTFAALLHKYQSGHASPDERQVVEQWYALLDEQPRPLNAQGWQDLEDRLWIKLERQAFNRPAEVTKRIPFWRRSWGQVGIAASVALLLTLGYALTRPGTRLPDPLAVARQQTKGLKRIVNTRPTVQVVRLEDGSQVWLNPESELKFANPFAPEQREVWLTGEAFFAISENAKRPFLVHAGLITTKVLGTSFRVRSMARNADVEVAVRTGKVAVYEQAKAGKAQSTKNGNGVILSPNHRVMFSAESRLFVTSLVENPVVLKLPEASQNASFVFDDTPLQDVLMQLENAYSIDIEVERRSLNDCPLTANLGRKSLYAQLDLICAAIEGAYEVKGTTILISGKGCEN